MTWAYSMKSGKGLLREQVERQGGIMSECLCSVQTLPLHKWSLVKGFNFPEHQFPHLTQCQCTTSYIVIIIKIIKFIKLFWSVQYDIHIRSINGQVLNENWDRTVEKCLLLEMLWTSGVMSKPQRFAWVENKGRAWERGLAKGEHWQWTMVFKFMEETGDTGIFEEAFNLIDQTVDTHIGLETSLFRNYPPAISVSQERLFLLLRQRWTQAPSADC